MWMSRPNQPSAGWKRISPPRHLIRRERMIPTFGLLSVSPSATIDFHVQQTLSLKLRDLNWNVRVALRGD